MYNEGISKMGDLIDLGTEMEIIDKRGSYYSYGEIRLGQGRENAKEFLRQNEEIAEEIEHAVREGAGGIGMMPDNSNVFADDEDESLEEM